MSALALSSLLTVSIISSVAFAADGKSVPVTLQEKTWANALVAGDKVGFLKVLTKNPIITENFQGKPTPTSLDNLFARFKGCKLSKYARNGGDWYLKSHTLSFDCGRGYDDVIEYKMAAKKLSVIHFFANAPCATKDCK